MKPLDDEPVPVDCLPECPRCRVNKGLAFRYKNALESARDYIEQLRQELGLPPKGPRYFVDAEPPRPFRGVYFIESGGYIKIGVSSDVRTRAKHLQLQARPSLLGYLPISDREESLRREGELHKQFAFARCRGEWFRDCDEIRAFILTSASAWPV